MFVFGFEFLVCGSMYISSMARVTKAGAHKNKCREREGIPSYMHCRDQVRICFLLPFQRYKGVPWIGLESFDSIDLIPVTANDNKTAAKLKLARDHGHDVDPASRTLTAINPTQHFLLHMYFPLT